MKIKPTLLALACAVSFTACAERSPYASQQPEYGFALHADEETYYDDKAKKEKLERETFKLNLIRVTDLRAPDSRAPLEEDYVIYDYQPGKLLSGLTDYIKSSMNKHMARGSADSQQLFLEVDVKKFQTSIEHMWFNRYGKYVVDIEMDVLVRDAKSRVLLRETVAERKDVKRYSYKGEMPTVKRDEREIKKVVKMVMDELTIDTGWMVHKAFNKQRKYYHPMRAEDEWLGSSK